MKFAEIVVFIETCKFCLDQLSMRYIFCLQVCEMSTYQTYFITCWKLNFYCLFDIRINFAFHSRGFTNPLDGNTL